MKSNLLRLLHRVGLLLPVFRAVELMRALGAEKEADGPDGLPIPPPVLRVQVAGTRDIAWFLEGGRLSEESIRGALARAGAALESHKAILDFGCGCGRVLRRWRNLDGRVCGTDYSERLINWCRSNLPFVEVNVNALMPPLRYGNASFDLVYALSVFTHLPVEMQFAWRDELRRVVRPGGYLLLSLHGGAYVEQLTNEERAVYDTGGCVVRWPKGAGANLCSTFHSSAFVRDRIAAGWELVEHLPRGALGCPEQDLVLLRKPQIPRARSALEPGHAARRGKALK
jgi:SAM-dependent methyltransferase